MYDRRRIRRTGIVVAAAVLAVAGPPDTRAQTPGQLDGGRFRHTVGAAYAGTETFAVRRRGAAMLAVGRVTREGGPEALRSFEVGLRTDPRGRPLRYELRTLEGSPTHIVVNRSGSRLRVTTSTAEGERFTELLSDDRMLLLEPEVAHHYAFVARRLRSLPDPRALRLDVLIPGAARKVALRVGGLERDSLQVGGQRVAATRVDLSMGQEAVRLWIDADGDRVLRVALPDRGWAATRIPSE